MEQYPDGVWLAELAPLTEPPLVEETVAGLFGLSGTGERQAGDLLPGYLREKKLLLILDNCEHLVAAAAALAAKLLRGCAQVSILASSREVLGIAGEQVYRVAAAGQPGRRAGPDRGGGLSLPGRPPAGRSGRVARAASSSSTTTTRPISRRSAGAWTASRSPSNWPRPGSACSSRSSSWPGSTIASAS